MEETPRTSSKHLPEAGALLHNWVRSSPQHQDAFSPHGTTSPLSGSPAKQGPWGQGIPEPNSLRAARPGFFPGHPAWLV